MRGFALVLVIWILALLALLAAAVAADSHSGALVARNRLDIAQARNIADAGVTMAIVGLLDPDPDTRWQVDGRPRNEQYGDGAVQIVVEDEGGKIDLNQAPIELIGGLLAELGVDGDRQTLLTNAILERRAALATKDVGVPGGFFPRSQPYATNLAKLAFADVSELRLLPGMDSPLYARLAPDVTVYAQTPTINPLTAPREVLLAVPGASESDVDALIAARGGGARASDMSLSQLTTLASYTRIDSLRAATITAQASIPSRAAFTREAVVLVSPDLPIQPLRILRWRQPVDTMAGGTAAGR